MYRKKKTISFMLTFFLGLCFFCGCFGGERPSHSTSESESGSAAVINREKDTRGLTSAEYTRLNLSGTDALGRSFETVDAENKDLYVGMFYFLWLGQHSGEQNGIYDITKITENGANMDAFYYTNDASE